MEDEKPEAQTDQDFTSLRAAMTILFSDIKGSTKFAEKRGDVEYMAMIDRHNRMLFPVIEAENGHVVKTIGDAILARFEDPVSGVKAAVRMQRALAKDREGRSAIDQIRIRIGLHHGMGLVKDDDVFGDVVNAAAHVEHQAQAGQVLITGALLEAAKSAGFECAKMGRAGLKGKDEPIDLYAVAWSDSATQQLLGEVEERYERKIRELKKDHNQGEEEFEKARDQWRTERRTLHAEIEELNEALKVARQTARDQLSEDLQAEFRFQIGELTKARDQLEKDLTATHQRFEAERENLKSQLATMQTNMVDAMARSNNPVRTARAIREQVEARVVGAKEELEIQWQNERKRLIDEIERLKTGVSPEEKKKAARLVLLQKLGKVPGPAPATARTAEEWASEFQSAKTQWDAEREQLQTEVQRLGAELQLTRDAMNSEGVHDVRAEYEVKLTGANRERYRLEQEIQFLNGELATERQRLNARIEALEAALPQAQEVSRKQTLAELQNQLDAKIEEANRVRSRMERNYKEASGHWEDERRRAQKQLQTLEEELREAREAAYKAQKNSSPSISS